MVVDRHGQRPGVSLERGLSEVLGIHHTDQLSKATVGENIIFPLRVPIISEDQYLRSSSSERAQR